MQRKIIGCICLMALLVAALPMFAQAVDPYNAANDVREGLFDAQGSLMSGDTAAAVEAVAAARDIYTDALLPSLAEVGAAERLGAAFEQAEDAVEAGDSLGLAAARGQVWAALLDASAQMTLRAVERGDAEAAWGWLALRDFRPSTRFSRPNADGALAVAGLRGGTQTPAQALEAVRADLLDTYQSQLNGALADADGAAARGFAMRRAEEAGLAAGYFEILAPAFVDQRGGDALDSARTAFERLVTAAVNDDSAAFTEARADVDAVMSGFRAAPLSADEQARRAGQLMRFLALVPVEYARGVRDGQVVHDIEIQEALTFREGAAMAFADLRVTLEAIDSQAVARVDGLLDTTLTQIETVADPAALQATVDETAAILRDLMPAEWQSLNSDADVDVIFSVLDQVEAAVKQGQYTLAESARLEAYSLLELGMEQRLNGFAPDMAVEIEALFWQGDGAEPGLAALLANHAPLDEVQAALGRLRGALTEAQTAIFNARSAPTAVAGNAAVIVFREGLEAVLILASLLASLRSAADQQFRKPLVIGAALAFAATGLTWWVANGLLMSLIQYGERLEAVVSLIAIGVLLLITNWFFHKVYWTGWMANFHEKKRRIIGGALMSAALSQSLALVALGFASIYREGFETVLFLQSLVLDAGLMVVLQGVALGLVGVAIVGVITFALQVKLPYKRMLIVTGIMIGGVLIVMVGNTVHVMQAVGWLPITPINGLHIPFWMGQWLGLFATWQGIGLQVGAAAFVIGSYFLAEHQTRTRRHERVQPVQAQTGLAGD